jgi:hypothetical protein
VPVIARRHSKVVPVIGRRRSEAEAGQRLLELEAVKWHVDGVVALLHHQMAAPRGRADHDDRLALVQEDGIGVNGF